MGDHEISKHLYHAAPACGSALLAALLLARGRAGRVLGGNRIIGVLLLHPISGVIGNHDRDHDQQDPDQDAGLLVVGVEQKLHDIIHGVFSFPAQQAARGLFTARCCRSRPVSWARQ